MTGAAVIRIALCIINLLLDYGGRLTGTAVINSAL